MNEQFWWAACGAICGWFMVFIAVLLYKYLKIRKNAPKKRKGACLLIGNPGSGAKKLFQSNLLEKQFENVYFYEKIHAALCDLFPDKPVCWTCLNHFDCIIIYGWLSGSDIKLTRDFLLYNRINSKLRLCNYLPQAGEYDYRAAVLFERKEHSGIVYWRWEASTIDATALREKGCITKVDG